MATKLEIERAILKSTHVGGAIHLKDSDTEYISVANKLCKLGMLERMPREYYTQYPIRYKVLRKSPKGSKKSEE